MFPKTARESYEFNPLDEVTCQLRFPTLLRIETAAPAELQEKIREAYPIYKRRVLGQSPTGSVMVPPEILAMLPPGAVPSHSAHEFATVEGTWKVFLTKDYISLSCYSYDDWEAFSKRLDGVLSSFGEIYRPSFYSRIGLRYRNVIRRGKLKIEDKPWYELLNESLLGEMASEPLRNAVFDGVMKQLLFKLEDPKNRVRLQHGLVMDQSSIRFPDTIPELFYLIDTDSFCDTPTGVEDARSLLSAFNEESGNLFRWCIKDPLRTALKPEPVNRGG